MNIDATRLASTVALSGTKHRIEGVDAIFDTLFLKPVNSSPDQ
jgi:hypothetical protein